MINIETLLYALILTSIAGLSTTIGSLTVFIFKEPSKQFISIIMGFSAGVMILISFVELLAVGIPIYTSTKNSKKAFFWSFISGVSEPIGALIAGLVLFQFINDFVLRATLAVVGGFMVYISLDELLPASRYSGFEHLSIIGIIIGMVVMAISLDLL